jgi:hypothetical protein
MDWISLAEDRERRWDVVNMAMNLWDSIIYREFLDQLRICYLLRRDSAS